MLVISTLSKMEAKIEVGEHEVVYVKEGDPAEVEIDAFPDRKFPAQVVEVARNATVKNQGTEGEVTTFFVRLALTEPVPGALPGMSAQASIATDTRDDAVAVPIQAVTVRPEREVAGGPPAREKAPAGDGDGPGPAKKARREPLKKVVFVIEGGRGEDPPRRDRPRERDRARDHLRAEGGREGGGGAVPGPLARARRREARSPRRPRQGRRGAKKKG